MENLFLKILNMSLTASWVIAVVLVIRALLVRAPKKYRYALWSVVGFRLCCPFSLSAAFSLLRFAPWMKTVPAAAAPVQTAAAQAAPLVTRFVPELTASALPAAAPQASADPVQIWITVGAAVWCIGMAAVALYSLISYGLLQHKVAAATRLRGNVWQSEQVCSPFILGVVRPKIYIPYGLEPNALRYVLAHERYHLARRDHLVKVLAFVLLAMHWFNPLCWVAFWLMDRDMEMSCDEKVLEQLGGGRKAYSTTLLSFAANRRFPIGTPLAFGENSVKSRIRNTLSWRRPRFYVTLTATVLCLAVLVGCAVNPARESETPAGPAAATEPSAAVSVPTAPAVTDPGTVPAPTVPAESLPAAPAPSPVEPELLSPQVLQAVSSQLDLPAGQITAEHLAAMTELTLINLQSSDLASLELFSNVQHLTLYSPAVSDYSALAKLSGLQTLDLISPEHPDLSTLRTLSGLQSLRVEPCEARELAALASMTQLRELHLELTSPGDCTPLAQLTSLETLQLTGADGDLSFLRPLTNLRTLHLSGSFSDLTPIGSLSGLENLSLSESRIPDPEPLAQLTGLKYLYLDACGLTDLQPLSALVHLRYLDLCENAVSDLTPLAQLRELEGMDLRGNRLTDISVLNTLPALKQLELEGNPVSAADLIAQVPDLKLR